MNMINSDLIIPNKLPNLIEYCKVHEPLFQIRIAITNNVYFLSTDNSRWPNGLLTDLLVGKLGLNNVIAEMNLDASAKHMRYCLTHDPLLSKYRRRSVILRIENHLIR
jgi:hypothetical protein